MISERSTGTLVTAFSGVAALMCLLAGVQLFILQSQIGQAADLLPAGSDGHFRLWSAEARSGAVMSLGAGVLILLFAIRHHLATRPGRGAGQVGTEDFRGTDIESVSVRVFEVDDLNQTVEVTREPEPPADQPGKPWAEPHHLPDEEPQPFDPTETIVRSIHAASTPGQGTSTISLPKPRKSLLNNILRYLGILRP